MDGLVSTGNKFPYTILKIIFSNRKFFMNYFINIFFSCVDKDSHFSMMQLDKVVRSCSCFSKLFLRRKYLMRKNTSVYSYFKTCDEFRVNEIKNLIRLQNSRWVKQSDIFFSFLAIKKYIKNFCPILLFDAFFIIPRVRRANFTFVQ